LSSQQLAYKTNQWQTTRLDIRVSSTNLRPSDDNNAGTIGKC
jgi:hypothetical protein